MRIEGCSSVVLREGRRQRFVERRADNSDRRRRSQTTERRARHETHVWFQPAFGAHILGQIAPETVTPEAAARAYQQPEARTPLRPSLVQKA